MGLNIGDTVVLFLLTFAGSIDQAGLFPGFSFFFREGGREGGREGRSPALASAASASAGC